MSRRWRPLGKGQEGRTDIELAVRANNVEVNNERGMNRLMAEEVEEEFRQFWNNPDNQDVVGRNIILTAFCPQVGGVERGHAS